MWHRHSALLALNFYMLHNLFLDINSSIYFVTLVSLAECFLGGGGGRCSPYDIRGYNEVCLENVSS